MATQSKEQQETVERVMHEFKEGELKTSAGKKVKNPKQAIAIGLREAGASKYESDEKNEENLRRTKERERRGETAEDTAEEGGGGDSRQSGTAAAPETERTKEELYRQAKEKDIPGRSEMNKQELAAAVKKAGK